MVLTINGKHAASIVLILIFSIPGLLAQDWANFERFKEANEKLGMIEEGETRVVLMGNSITQEWPKLSADFFKGKPYINRGISGQTTPQMLVRFRADVVDLKPQVVVILAGTNDIAENTGPTTLQMIMDNIASMSEIAVANNIKVILCAVLPAFDYPWRPGLSPNEKIPALNAMIEAYAMSTGHVYLDYFSAMTDGNDGLRKELTYDGVHPDKNGYKVMEPMLEKAVAEVRE